MIQARIGKKIPPGFSLDVEFEAGPGVTALYGPAGSGKTAVLDALTGFAKPDSGRILLDDVLLFDAAAGVHVPARRRRCGYIFSRDALFPQQTLRQNLEFAARGARLERHRRIAEMIERFQLSDYAALRPAQTAPEERLRAAVARAVIAEPKVLLLDDPGVVLPLLDLLRAEFPGPLLLASRDLELCCAAAGQMLVLDRGRILARGSPGDVLDQPESVEVARLVGMPNLFECTITGLDPGRNSSRLAAADFELSGPYFPGHFRGDRVWIGIRAERVRVVGGGPRGPNAISARLVRVWPRTHGHRLEFAGAIFADLSSEEYERQKDNREWLVEFPADALRLL